MALAERTNDRVFRAGKRRNRRLNNFNGEIFASEIERLQFQSVFQIVSELVRCFHRPERLEDDHEVEFHPLHCRRKDGKIGRMNQQPRPAEPEEKLQEPIRKERMAAVHGAASRLAREEKARELTEHNQRIENEWNRLTNPEA